MGSKHVFDSSIPHLPFTGGTPERIIPDIEKLKLYNLKYFSEAFRDDKLTCDSLIVEEAGHTLLHESIIRGSKDIFRLCEIYGADWNKRDVLGATPLMKAAAQGNIYFMEKLIDLGADRRAKDFEGRTAQEYASVFGEYEAAEFLASE